MINNANGKILIVPGGLVIKEGDKVVGSIGISGSDNDGKDEDIAKNAIEEALKNVVG